MVAQESLRDSKKYSASSVLEEMRKKCFFNYGYNKERSKGLHVAQKIILKEVTVFNKDKNKILRKRGNFFVIVLFPALNNRQEGGD